MNKVILLTAYVFVGLVSVTCWSEEKKIVGKEADKFNSAIASKTVAEISEFKQFQGPFAPLPFGQPLIPGDLVLRKLRSGNQPPLTLLEEKQLQLQLQQYQMQLYQQTQFYNQMRNQTLMQLNKCGAAIDESEAKKMNTMTAQSAYTVTDGITIVDMDQISKSISKLKQDCETLGRVGGFYICRKGNSYSYYNAGFRKVSTQNCDLVYSNGDSATCLQKTSSDSFKQKYKVVEIHKSATDGSAACSQASQPPPQEDNHKGRGGGTNK